MRLLAAISERLRGRRRTVAMAAAVTLVAAGLTGVAVGTAQAATTACQVTYTKQSEWNVEFTAAITIKNDGADAWTNWTLGFAFLDANQKMTQGWSANWSQSGSNVT